MRDVDLFRAELERELSTAWGYDWPVSQAVGVVGKITQDWRVRRHETASGVSYTVETPVRPLTEAEQERQRAWRELAEARREWLDGEQDTPPPASVTIFDLLDQGVWWRTGAGVNLRLVDMTPPHRSNLLEFMKRNAMRWHVGEVMGFPDFFGDAPDEVLEPSSEWLKRQELYQALKKLVKKDRKAARAE